MKRYGRINHANQWASARLRPASLTGFLLPSAFQSWRKESSGPGWQGRKRAARQHLRYLLREQAARGDAAEKGESNMKKVTVAEHYDLLVQEGDDPAQDPPALRDYMDNWDGQPFLNALGLSSESGVLEIGVGTGRLAKRVLEIGCGHFTGIDISSAAIQRAKQNVSDWSNVTLIQGDFMTCQFPRTFDVVYCSLALFHFQDKAAFLRKTAEWLNAKGRVGLSVPKEKEKSIVFGSRQVELYPDDLDTLKALLTDAGLVLTEAFDVEFAHVLVAEKA